MHEIEGGGLGRVFIFRSVGLAWAKT